MSATAAEALAAAIAIASGDGGGDDDGGAAAVRAALARDDCTAAVLNAAHVWTGPLALALREACGTGRKPGEALATSDTVVLAPGATGRRGWARARSA